MEALRYARDGAHDLLVGHADHDEVIGTTRRGARADVIVVEDVEDAETLEVPDPEHGRLPDADDAVASTTPARSSRSLRRRFPKIDGPA